MALVVKDRVKETTATTGTVTLTLAGAVTGFQSFSSALSDGDTTYYAIFESSTGEWEVGLGTFTASGTTLARTTVLASSNSGSAVNLTAGSAEVFITQPATKAAYFDASGDLILNQDPTANLQAATKQYVDTIAAAGLHYHAPVRVEEPSNLTVTYDNGTSGVGATLTNAGTQAALVLDNVTMVVSDRVLIANQTNQAHNGVYTVTNIGSASTNWVLTRATDADSYSPSDPDALGEGDAFFIKEGDTNAGHLDVMTTSGEIIFGTTNIVFSEVAETTVYSAGDGLTLTGTTFAVGAGTGVTVNANDIAIGQDVATTASPTFAGLTTTADINFGDDDKAIFGAGSDLSIYHDGSDSYIRENGTGSLFIQSNNNGIVFEKTDGENIGFIDTINSRVVLYNGGNQKLATTSTGVDVTGNIAVSGTVDGRDVATDGTKLDGIEASADVTDTANVVAALTAGTNITIAGDGTISSTDTNTTYSAGTALDLSGTTFNVDLSELTTSTADGDGDFFVVVDSVNAQKKLTKGNINISGFNNDAGYTTNVGDITGVTAGSFLTGGGTSGTVTVNVDATSANTASKVVARDASGNFSAGTITATLNGNASTATSATNADTVDSLHASQFLRSDATDHAAGRVTWPSSDVLETSTSYQSNLEVYQDTSGADAFMSFHVAGDFAAYFGLKGDINDFAVGGWSMGNNYYRVWHSGNDGSGSGLDADTTDGYQASESFTGSTLAARNSNGDLSMRYALSSYLNMSHSSTTRSSDTIFYSSTDNYLRKNNATGFKTSLGLNSTDSPSFAGLNINGNLNAVDNIYLAGTLYHEGDTNTYLTFGTDTITLATGGSSEITVNTTGVRLGDTGNGYFQPVSGNYGSIQIDGGAHDGWEGYSIGGRAVFMHDNTSAMGLYDDVYNHWKFYAIMNGATYLGYGGTYNRLETTSTGVNINGDLNAVDNIYVAGNIYHEGDTNTNIRFGTDTITLRTGGTDRFVLTDARTQIDTLLTDAAVAEDYDALSGTTPTADPDNGGAFSLTMTGNTTFTFGAPSLGSGVSTGFIIELTGNATTAYTVTWPTSVEWAGGTAPDAPAVGETDIYVFWTRDGGTTWYGVQSIDAAA